MTVVSVLCTLGCGVKIPVPMQFTTEPGEARRHDRALHVMAVIAPEFDDQLDWHMRRFHSGPRGGLPVEVAA